MLRSPRGAVRRRGQRCRAPITALSRFAGVALALALALSAVGYGDAHAATADAPAPDSIVVDGRLDEAAWRDAEVFDDFIVTEPFTLTAPTLPTTARLLATPDGIAVGFELGHPADVPRIVERTARDGDQSGDRVNVYLDFDADAQIAYNFSVAISGSISDGTFTNEVAFSDDWDGDWEHAVHAESDRWFVEILIPWTTASMRDSGEPTREVGILLDRYLATRQERSSTGPASFRQPRFVSDFPKVTIRQYQQGLLRLFPYVTALRDFIGAANDFKAGLDLFWKPSGDFQLAAALKPDFGQVEADELVVNFDAIEAFQSDKRPFFTENQGPFDVRTPDSGLVIYTRRIGGPRDNDSDRAAEIDAALKLNGAWRGITYGSLAALESDYDDAGGGSAFFAQRLAVPSDTLTIGWLGTIVDRPFLDRRAVVNGIDAQWRPNAALSLSGQILASDVRTGDARRDGNGAWVRALYTASPAWRHELEATHFSAGLNFNDFGFQRRPSLNELEWTTAFTDTAFADDSRVRSREWRVEPQLRWNDRGVFLAPVAFLNSNTSLRDGSSLFAELRVQPAGIDDLISRGNGDARLESRHYAYAEYDSRRFDRWRFELSALLAEEGLDGVAFEPGGAITYEASETLTLDAFAYPRFSRDWLLWRDGTLFARFESNRVRSGLNVNWFPAEKHEVRIKTEWVGIDAREPRSYRLGPDARLRASADAVAPFTVNSFGFQVRWRWEFRPQSDLFVVYSRGGEETLLLSELEPATGFDGLFADAIGLRDADQFLVKLRYRF